MLKVLGGIFRKRPICTTILLVCLGFFIGYGLIGISMMKQDLSYYWNNFNAVFLKKPLSHMLQKTVDNSSLFFPIMLAPYFWVLWIWRHNNKEIDNRRNIDDKMEDLTNSVSKNDPMKSLYAVQKSIKIINHEKLKQHKIEYCKEMLWVSHNLSNNLKERFASRNGHIKLFNAISYLQKEYIKLTNKPFENMTFCDEYDIIERMPIEIFNHRLSSVVPGNVNNNKRIVECSFVYCDFRLNYYNHDYKDQWELNELEYEETLKFIQINTFNNCAMTLSYPKEDVKTKDEFMMQIPENERKGLEIIWEPDKNKLKVPND